MHLGWHFKHQIPMIVMHEIALQLRPQVANRPYIACQPCSAKLPKKNFSFFKIFFKFKGGGNDLENKLTFIF